MSRSDTHPREPHPVRRILLMTVAVLLVVAGGVGVSGLLTPSQPARLPSPSPSASVPMPSAPGPRPSASTTTLCDPHQFARLVAETLYDWDTTVDTPYLIRNRLLDWADPAGDETNGLVTDLRLYLPSPDTWATLRTYGTVQTLQINSIEAPLSWPNIVASASPSRLRPGTSAWTITGLQHREGVAFGQPTSADRPVAFTMFLTCEPTFPECHLIRLGQPDKPLQ